MSENVEQKKTAGGGASSEEARRRRKETWQRKAEEKAIQKALEEKRNPPPPPKVGGKGNKNGWKNGYFSLGMGESEEDKEMIARLLEELRSARKHEPVFNDHDLTVRIDEYFAECQSRGAVPTVEEMYICLGYSRRWGHSIRTGKKGGFSPDTARILERAHEMMAAFDAKLVMTGKLHPTNYIFRSKNYHGLKDEQEVVVSASMDERKRISVDEISKRYLADGAKIDAPDAVETTFSDGGA